LPGHGKRIIARDLHGRCGNERNGRFNIFLKGTLQKWRTRLRACVAAPPYLRRTRRRTRRRTFPFTYHHALCRRRHIRLFPPFFPAAPYRSAIWKHCF
jgi:hypothetical protein